MSRFRDSEMMNILNDYKVCSAGARFIKDTKSYYVAMVAIRACKRRSVCFLKRASGHAGKEYSKLIANIIKRHFSQDSPIIEWKKRGILYSTPFVHA